MIKMIILDLNQVMISNIMALYGKHIDDKPIEIDLFRSVVLNNIRFLNMKFKSEYGKLIIASDGRGSWRKDVFPYYKANRKKKRQESTIDWSKIFDCLNTVRDEIKHFFPYPVINVDSAEADDVIGVLVKDVASQQKQEYENEKKILIISGDKDFIQLQKYNSIFTVKQYDPINKKYIKTEDPSRYIKEHILKGDTGDGIPNFLSPDDCLVNGIRQKPIMKKKLSSWVNEDPKLFCDDIQYRNYKRNQLLIDLDNTPKKICDNIMKEYDNQKGKGRSQIFNYMVKNRLKMLMESIGDF